MLYEGVLRSPAFVFDSLLDAGLFVDWVVEHVDTLRAAAEATTAHGRLVSLEPVIDNNVVFLLCRFTTGDAAGPEHGDHRHRGARQGGGRTVPRAPPRRWYVEGNFSGDKKATSLGTLTGRGRKVSASVTLPAEIVRRVLRSDIDAMLDYGRVAGLGALMSGQFGAQAHYANALAALYIATGQDAACVAESAVGFTRMERRDDGAVLLGDHAQHPRRHGRRRHRFAEPARGARSARSRGPGQRRRPRRGHRRALSVRRDLDRGRDGGRPFHRRPPQTGAPAMTAPLARRLWIYQAERFPLARTLPLLAVFAAASLNVSALLAGRPLPGPGAYIVAALLAVGIFFQMRAFDEAKDLEDDRRYRPERPIPRGLVSLGTILTLAGLAGAAMLALAGSWTPGTLATLLLVWLWLALMTAEFGAPAWLKARPLLYLVSHMAIMPLIDLMLTGIEWTAADAGRRLLWRCFSA